VDELLSVAIEAATAAGRFLLEGRGSARRIETKSSATDMVSEMDRGAEELIRAVIAERRPDDAVLGEEGGEIAGTAGQGAAVRWIVDPLDGTTNYLYGFPAWCVSVAAAIHGVVAAGAVFDPTHDELWTAEAASGAACNGTPIAPLEDRGDLATALVSTGFSYDADRRATQGAIVAALLPQVRDIRRAGSAALDLCWLAAGRVDAYFETGTHVWDWAAGALVATEAGAWVGGFDGGPPSDSGILAGRPGVAARLRPILATAASSRR
jgi:myo-inositol-1(or 4)-monophosphatase